MHTSNTKAIGFAAGIISTALLGTVGFFIRNISANVYTITFVRVALSLIFLTIYILLKKQMRIIPKVKITFPLFASGALLSLIALFYTNAINTTTLANAAFLLNLGPLIAVAIMALFLQERFTLKHALLLSLAFLGLLFLLEFKMQLNFTQSNGYLWGGAASICYALFIVLNRNISKNIPVLARSFYQFLFATIIMLPFLDASLLRLTQQDAFWLLAIGFLQGFLALTLFTLSLKNLQAIEFGTIAYIEPLVASLMGLYLYKEVLSTQQTIGCVIVLGAGLTQVILARKVKE